LGRGQPITGDRRPKIGRAAAARLAALRRSCAAALTLAPRRAGWVPLSGLAASGAQHARPFAALRRSLLAPLVRAHPSPPAAHMRRRGAWGACPARRCPCACAWGFQNETGRGRPRRAGNPPGVQRRAALMQNPPQRGRDFARPRSPPPAPPLSARPFRRPVFCPCPRAPLRRPAGSGVPRSGRLASRGPEGRRRLAPQGGIRAAA